jgi:hypothetical protein
LKTAICPEKARRDRPDYLSVGISTHVTDRDNIRVAETDEELLTFDVSDETLERAVPIVGGQPPFTRVYGTAADCGYCLVGVPGPGSSSK